MKKQILLTLIIVIAGIKLSAQFYPDWTEPVEITDSLSVNSNPNVLLFYDMYGDDLFCFYEKKHSEESPSQIWYRNVYTMEPEQQVFGNDTVEYRNPQCISYNPYSGARYFVIFESNQTGNYEIYGVEFFPSGSFGLPFNLTNTTSNENSLFINQSPDWGTTCWKTEDELLVASLSPSGDTLQFDDIYTIDETNSFDPVCSSRYYVFYRKIINDSSQIWFSHFDYQTNQWSEPDTVFTMGNNINLSAGSQMFASDDYSICWENNGQVLGYDAALNEIIPVNFQGITACFEPTFYAYDMITSESFYLSIFSFCAGEGDSREVFVSDYYGAECRNLSNNSFYDSNPMFCNGRDHHWYHNVINIWQTHKNGNVVLSMSQLSLLLGDIPENYKGNSEILLKAFPLPFKNRLTIEYFLDNEEEIMLGLYSMSGQPIFRLFEANHTRGWNTFETDIEKYGLKSGVYYVVLKQGQKQNAVKVVVAK